MGWFRRRESLHERLAREGGLTAGKPAPYDTTPRWGEVGVHGIARPRQWDAVVAVEAPELPGEEVHFVALPDGSLVVDEAVPDGALDPLAEALESHVRLPYRAEAVRRGGSRWAVAARAIEVVELPQEVSGDEIDLAVREGERTLSIDGLPSLAVVPALERLGGSRFDAYAVHAERLDGNLWEARVNPL